MTSAPVTSITDEQLAEIEDGVNYLYGTATLAPEELVRIELQELSGIINRLRAAEKDADRYRFLRNNGVRKLWDSLRKIYPFNHKEFDSAIDRVIQESKK